MSYPLQIDPETGGLTLQDENRNIVLHPLWVRERVRNDAIFDKHNNQRLYEPAELPADMKITRIISQNDNVVELEFSDGDNFNLALPTMLKEIGWAQDPEAPPIPKSWTTALNTRPEADGPILMIL